MKTAELLASSFLFIISLSFSLNARGQEKEEISVSVQGHEDSNSCSPAEKMNLQHSLYKEKVPNKSEAWRLLEILLCAPSTNANVSEILKSTKSKIKVEAEGTGDPRPDTGTVTATTQFIQTVLAQGRARSASIVVLHNTIKLHYFPNEACVEERVFEFSRGKWKLVEAGQACD
ncbi:hypothetical protein [Massilia sp. 9I]|uniref:hypothetical protein n=1 Tax=Massilia sp. 9I TaxID=2653152 RepID=UPI0012F3F42B|nr:hypothetical protein [Massilia sp. 9I]VXC26888.1 exported hypothetical protein [Massilia sp. 9I]